MRKLLLIFALFLSLTSSVLAQTVQVPPPFIMPPASSTSYTGNLLNVTATANGLSILGDTYAQMLAAIGACPVFQLIDGHGSTTNLTSAQVTCPSMVTNTGQSGASASVVWPTKANNQSITVKVATTVATNAAPYLFEVDFGSAVVYPNGVHTTAYRYCGWTSLTSTTILEGNYAFVSFGPSSTYGSSGIAGDWTDGVGTSYCRN